MEHNGVVADASLPRYAQIDPVILIFGSFPACAPFVQPPPEGYQHMEWPWQALLAAHPNGHFAWHSDRGAALFPLSPLNHLYSMVTQWEVDVDDVTTCPTPEYLSHKTLTVEQALPMMNIGAAYALDRDSEVGSLVPGKLADLIILDDNPTTCAPSQINDIQVCATIVGGQTAFRLAGYDQLCPTRLLSFAQTTRDKSNPADMSSASAPVKSRRPLRACRSGSLATCC
jgi:predicted amidohydrolase YtcJ